MKLLELKDFECLNMDQRTRGLSKYYYEKGYIQSMEIVKIKKYYGIEYQINAVVIKSEHINECSILIDEFGNVASYKCDCPWASYGICAHVGAVLYKLCMLDIEQFPYHFGKADYEETQKKLEEIMKQARLEQEQRMMKSFFENSNRLIDHFHRRYDTQLQSLLDQTKYTIFSFLNISPRDKILACFRIGSQEKNYQIRSIGQLINSFNDKSYFKYGKFLNFIHDENHFDTVALKWIHFMKKYYGKECYTYSFWSAGYNKNSEICIDEENIDEFFDVFSNEKLPNIQFKEEFLKYPIRIEKRENYYLVSALDSFSFKFETERAFYALDDRILTRYTVDGLKVMELMDMLSNGSLYIENDKFTDFYNYVLLPNEKALTIEWEKNELMMLNSTLSGCKVYGDLFDDKTVVFHAIGYDGENEVEIIKSDNRYSGFQVDLIKSVFENNADYIEDHNAFFNLDKPETYELIHEKTQILSKYCDVFVSEDLKKIGQKTHYSIAVGVRMSNNLLAVDLKSDDFDINEVYSILQAYRRKKRYYRLKSGLMIHLESDELEELDSLMNDYNIKSTDIKNGTIQLENYRALSLDRSLDKMEYIQVEKGKDLSQYIKGFENMSADIEIKEEYKDVLRPYQKIGAEWLLTLYKYNLNGILADEMGLGKTIQVISVLDSIKEDSKTSLVVCPSSLIYNWQDEVSKFSKSLSCISVTGSKQERVLKINEYKNYDLLITSYDYLRRDVDLYEDLDFEYVILDEAQYIKNQKTKNASSVKSLKARHRLALSGTPIENSLAELWSIFDFLMPGYLYSYHYFKTQFETPIVAGENKDVSQQLREMVSPFILRRVKSEVLKELPEKVDHKYLLDFSTEEKKIYLANLATVSKEMQEQMEAPNFDRMLILAMLTKLRQLCLDPRLVYDNIKSVSTKVSATIDLIKLMVEHNKKILLFSAFTSLLNLISEEFKKEGISYYMLTGSTNKEERRQLVNDFNNDDTNVFLISLKAGGTGLNLTSAEVVIHIDPWWNVSAQNQATDRAHRIGQNANVQVYRMIMKDSIEEKILLMQERKLSLAANFVEGNDGSLSKMSKDEIRSLFER